MDCSILALSRLTGKTREDIGKKLANVKFKDGKRGAKLYNSKTALAAIYLGNEDSPEGGEWISQAEANRRLTIAKRDEVALNIEIKRRERIPLEELEELIEQTMSRVVGILKARVGRPLSDDDLSEVLAEFRGIGAQLVAQNP